MYREKHPEVIVDVIFLSLRRIAGFCKLDDVQPYVQLLEDQHYQSGPENLSQIMLGGELGQCGLCPMGVSCFLIAI